LSKKQKGKKVGKPSKTIIELNGQSYDAKTGKPLNAKQAKPAVQHIDGIVRRPKETGATAKSKTARTTASHAAHHKPQSAKTLMRHVVKKPDASTSKKSSLKAAAPVGAHPKHLPAVKPKLSLHSVDSARQKHAAIVKQSTAIRRFAPIAPTTFEPVAAKPRSVPHTVAPVAPPAPASEYSSMLDRALQNATSHTQKSPKRHHTLAKKLSAASLSVLVVVGLGALVASQNLPGIRMQLASSKAGIEAGLPSYHPAGFHLQDITNGPGAVTINYVSNSNDGRAYTVTEKTSAWDSQALREAFVNQTADSFETAERAGRTIYIYGDNQATWVSGGIWYQVQTEGSLSSRQLVDLAASL
jgi:hypothetical protein